MVISVINQKGGVGKTTTAINLAACIAQQQQSILMVDLDPQGNATSGVGVHTPSDPSLYEALVAATDNHSTRQAEDDLNASDILLPQVNATSLPELAVVGTAPELAGAEIDLAGNPQRDDLKSILDTFSQQYPIIVIDTPPSLSLLTVNALVAADYLIIPVQCEYFALEGLGHLLRTLEMVKRGLNPSLQVLGLLRTMYDGRLGLSSQVSQEMERHFPQLLFQTIIPRNVRLAEAPSHGKPITLYDRRSPGADAYRRLAVEVLQRLGATYDRKELRYRLPEPTQS